MLVCRQQEVIATLKNLEQSVAFSVDKNILDFMAEVGLLTMGSFGALDFVQHNTN
jgi:hypothetical protein